MSLIGVISADVSINSVIRDEFNRLNIGDYTLQVLADEKRILEFLNFDLPEIVIINFSDKSINLDSILEQIMEDSWLHNFGIVGIYNHEEMDEEALLKKHIGLNILALLDPFRLRSHIVKCIKIIEMNRQIIFHRELSDKLVDKITGSFSIENDILAVSVYASIAATLLSQRGHVDPNAKMHLQLCLSELIVNAIEHGNCGITFDEKTKALDAGKSVVELVEEKTLDPVINDKRVYFEWEIDEDYTKFLITDEGNGFDVKGLKVKIEEEGPMALHGRGIKMARMFAHKLYYNNKGNMVVIIIKHNQRVLRHAPAGFKGEEVISQFKGDVIFEEGESSDFIYYISSGKYNVYHNDKMVGRISPEDIFMGEMSFLLNNRRSATVKAESDGKLIKISRKAFVTVIKDFPHYGIFLSKLLARKLVKANSLNAVSIPDSL